MALTASKILHRPVPCLEGRVAGASPKNIRTMVEDSTGVLWLVGGTLQRFEPATGRFSA